MINLDEAAWHEAGHAMIALFRGVVPRRVLIMPTADSSDWVGFTHLIRTEGDLRRLIATGGMAGELSAKATSFAAVDPIDLVRARNRAGDDVSRFDATTGVTQLGPFETVVASDAWAILAGNLQIYNALALELIQNQKIGPLVLAEISTGMTVTALSRRADAQFLQALHVHAGTPAPP